MIPLKGSNARPAAEGCIMAEEQKEPTQAIDGETPGPAPKKKGKLPAIIMLAVLLGAGGFFGMKMRAPHNKQKAPEVKLGEILKLKEFLVNLADGKTFLRTEMSLHLKEGVKIDDGGATEGGGSPEMAMIQDAIIAVLTSKTAREVGTLDGKRQLQRDIAAAVNNELNQFEAEKAGKPAPSVEKLGAAPSAKHPDWASDTGPVLRVYFTNFATQ